MNLKKQAKIKKKQTNLWNSKLKKIVKKKNFGKCWLRKIYFTIYYILMQIYLIHSKNIYEIIEKYVYIDINN